MTLKAFEDPENEGNSSKHHTGKECIEKGCIRPAGTGWSPHWCFECNAERMKRVDGQLHDVLESLVKKK